MVISFEWHILLRAMFKSNLYKILYAEYKKALRRLLQRFIVAHQGIHLDRGKQIWTHQSVRIQRCIRGHGRK